MTPPISSPHIPEKFYVKEYKAPPKTFLEKSVRWFEEKAPLPSRVKKVLEIAMTWSANILTLGLLLPLTFRIKDIAYRLEMEKAAKQFYKEFDETKTPPPPLDPIVMKSSTRAFNHVDEYAIENGTLWYRRKNGQPEKWQPLFFDGSMTGTKPVKLSVDGANMAVIDDKGQVHYRKVLIEGRGISEVQKKRFLRHDLHLTPTKRKEGEAKTYLAIDKSKKINWKPNWYSFPLLNRIFNAITGKKLTSSGIISHRGRFNQGYTDAKNIIHESTIGVTTLYELEKNRRVIRKYDPWAPLWANVQITLPETDHSGFIAEGIDVAASTLLSIGYDIDEKKQTATLKLFTNLYDIDTAGGNPLLSYAYESEEKTGNDLRFLADVVKNEGWTEHELPKEAAVLYNQITILQLGAGNDAREIRIAGEKEGKRGFFYKTLAPKSKWQFETNAHIDTSQPLERTRRSSLPKIEHFTHTYQSSNKIAKLSNFGQGTYHSTLKLTVGSKTYELPLHKRLGWKTFLGKKHEIYELVLPKKSISEKDPILKAFGNRRVIPLKIVVTTPKEGEQLKLNCQGPHPHIPLLQEERD